MTATITSLETMVVNKEKLAFLEAFLQCNLKRKLEASTRP